MNRDLLDVSISLHFNLMNNSMVQSTGQYHSFLLSFSIVLCLSIFLGCDSVSSNLNKASLELKTAEENIGTLTSEDISHLELVMEELNKHYEENSDNYTGEQVKELGRLQGRYAAIMVKKGASEIEESIKDLGNQMEGFIEGITDSPNNKNK